LVLNGDRYEKVLGIDRIAGCGGYRTDVYVSGP
jgi:hypothetical protein